MNFNLPMIAMLTDLDIFFFVLYLFKDLRDLTRQGDGFEVEVSKKKQAVNKSL